MVVALAAAPPLKIPIRVTGSFGEFRNDHLHAGIDFSTLSSTGHDVLAVKKGWLYRIKKRNTGEGNTIYLKHADETISVYAHLEDFIPKIESLAKHEIPYDFFPKEKLYFQEGETIGFSGESGRGFPHLHFEMRSSMSRALKSSMYVDGVSDTKKPELLTLQLVPFLIDEKPIHSPIDPKEEIQVNHPVGIAIQAFDEFNNSQSKCHIPEWRIYDHENLIYHSKMESVNHSRDYASAMHFLRNSTNLSPTVYVYKLYKDFTHTSPFIVYARDNGVLGPGLHDLRIEAEDFYGNVSKTSLKVRVKNSQIPQLRPYSGQLEFQEGPFKLILNKDGASSDSLPKLTLNNPRDELNNRGLIGLDISPNYLFFPKKAKLRYMTPIEGKEYFLRWNPTERLWEPIPFIKKSSTLDTEISLSGRYLIARDLQPPAIDTKIHLLRAKRRVFYYIKADDQDSGVDEQSLGFKCLESKIKAQFDPDRNWIRWSSGNCSTIWIKLCDKVGNCNTAQIKTTPDLEE